MSSYANLNTTGFTGQMGINNFNSSLAHNIYRVTPTYNWEVKEMDWQKVAGKTNEVATSTAVIIAGLEVGGKATPYMLKAGKYSGNLGTFAQIADNSIKVYKGEKNGGISKERYGYRMFGTGASWGVATVITEWGVGGASAGPYGVLAGILIGGTFQGLEYSYDIIAPQIQSSYNGFVNNLYSASYNAQFSGR